MYLSAFVGGLLFFIPIFALYVEEQLFTVTNVAIILAVEAIAFAIFEIPTGALSDLFGRKKAMILGHIMSLFALAFLYIGGSMQMFILYGILNAFGRSLVSGADGALIYDTLKSEAKENLFKKFVGTYRAIKPLGIMTGAIIGGYLAKVSLSLPVLLTVIPAAIAAILLIFLKEPEYEEEIHKNIFRHMGNSAKTIIGSKQLIIMLCGVFILGAMGETMHALGPLFFEFKEVPIEIFGWITASIFMFSSAGHYFSHEISEKWGNKKILLLTVIASPLLILISTLLTKYLAIIFFASQSLFYGMRNPILENFINKEVPSSKRATALSTTNFMKQIGYGIFSPFIGYFADLYTINTAFKISSLLMFAVFILYLFIRESDDKKPSKPATPLRTDQEERFEQPTHPIRF